MFLSIYFAITSAICEYIARIKHIGSGLKCTWWHYHMKPVRKGQTKNRQFHKFIQEETGRKLTFITCLLCERHSISMSSFNKIFYLKKARQYRIIVKGQDCEDHSLVQIMNSVTYWFWNLGQSIERLHTFVSSSVIISPWQCWSM